MPVGRFRTDPRDLDGVQRRVFSAQYPEGALVVGMAIGLAVPLVAGDLTAWSVPVLSNPVLTVLGPIFGGVAAYLVGQGVKRRKIDELQRAEAAESDGPPSATGGE